MRILKYYLLLLLLIDFMQISAQQFAFTGGSTGFDEATDVATDGSGNIYMTGYYSLTASFGANSLTSSGQSDIFIVKTNASGTIQWAVSAGGSGSDRGVSIKADNSGNVYVTGFYSGTANFGTISITSNSTSQDVFVAKYDSNGQIIWVKTGGGSSGDQGNGITIDGSGNVIVTGQFSGTANFGALSITSQNNPTSGIPSNDIFIVKYNSSGVEQWLKKGSANENDRGIDVAVDGSGDIYITGQFSDTVTFDVMHPNTLQNATFLVKYSASGVEQWFKRMGGNQAIAYGITCDNTNNVIITGDFLGNLLIFDGNAIGQTLTNTYSNRIFLLKFSPTGTFIWGEVEGSESELSSRSLTNDGSGNLFITGYFKCKLNEFADEYGQGTFNSVGYRDVFVAKYNSAGTRQWMRNFGGHDNDVVGGIAISNNLPVIAGSNLGRLIVPSKSGAITPSSVGINNISNTSTYCNDQNYLLFRAFNNTGNSDYFITNLIDDTREPYDFYKRDGSAGCVRPTVDVCINTALPDNICYLPDSVIGCPPILLSASTNTSANGPTTNGNNISAGPIFNYLWNNTVNTRTNNISTSGTYWVKITSVDGCFTSSDTIRARVHPRPAKPTITDNVVVNSNASITVPIDLCAGDTAIISVGSLAGLNPSWTGPGIPGGFNNDTILAFTQGNYAVTVTNSFGCTNSNSVTVNINPDFDTIIPKLRIISPTPINDTVSVCSNETIQILLYDSISNPTGTGGTPIPGASSATIIWSATPPAIASGTGTTGTVIVTDSSSFIVTAMLIRTNFCDTDTVVVSIPVNVNVLPAPVALAGVVGPSKICPGDTVLLVANYNIQGSWSGSNYIGSSTGDSIYITTAGNYSYVVTVTDTVNGCTSTATGSANVQGFSPPSITNQPSNGLICPGDSVQIIANNPSGDFDWFGPTGLLTDTVSSIFVNTPGFYYAVLVDPSGCNLVSNTIEVKQYTTPDIQAFPGVNFCVGTSATLLVFASDTTGINWLPPLSGNALSQIVNTPGTYSCSITVCGITTIADVTVNEVFPIIDFSFVGPTVLCLDDSVVISASAGSNYQWSQGATTQEITIFQPGSYWVNMVDPQGCSGRSDTLVITAGPISPSPSVPDTFACLGNTTTVTAFGNGDIFWYLQPNTDSVYATGNSIITPPIIGTQTYYVSNQDTNKCESQKIPVDVTIRETSLTPNIDLNANIFCIGDTVELFTDFYPDAIYQWGGPQGTVPQGNEAYYVFTDSILAVFSINISDIYCSSPPNFDTASIAEVIPDPLFALSCNEICQTETLQLNYSMDSLQTVWVLPNGNTIANSSLSTSVNSNNSSYGVYLQGKTCKSSILPVEIDVVDCEQPFPNVFTPNNDGINDVFKLPDTHNVTIENFKLYNRYGFLLDEWQRGLKVLWDGTANGATLPDGVYYYVAEFEVCGEAQKPVKGFVHIMR